MANKKSGRSMSGLLGRPHTLIALVALAVLVSFLFSIGIISAVTTSQSVSGSNLANTLIINKSTVLAISGSSDNINVIIRNKSTVFLSLTGSKNHVLVENGYVNLTMAGSSDALVLENATLGSQTVSGSSNNVTCATPCVSQNDMFSLRMSGSSNKFTLTGAGIYSCSISGSRNMVMADHVYNASVCPVSSVNIINPNPKAPSQFIIVPITITGSSNNENLSAPLVTATRALHLLIEGYNGSGTLTATWNGGSCSGHIVNNSNLLQLLSSACNVTAGATTLVTVSPALGFSIAQSLLCLNFSLSGGGGGGGGGGGRGGGGPSCGSQSITTQSQFSLVMSSNTAIISFIAPNLRLVNYNPGEGTISASWNGGSCAINPAVNASGTICAVATGTNVTFNETPATGFLGVMTICPISSAKGGRCFIVNSTSFSFVLPDNAFTTVSVSFNPPTTVTTTTTVNVTTVPTTTVNTTTTTVPVSSVVGTVRVGGFGIPSEVYNPSNGYVYVLTGTNVTVLNGTSVVASIPVKGASAVYDPGNGNLYVTTATSFVNTVYVIHGTSLIANLTAGGTILVNSTYNPSNGYVYVVSWGSGVVSIINGTSVIANLSVGGDPKSALYDPSNGRMYIINTAVGKVSVISGLSIIANITVGTGYNNQYLSTLEPNPAVYDSNNGYIYVPDVSAGMVAVINGTSVLTDINVGGSDTVTAFNPSNGYVYVASYSNNSVSMINGVSVVGTVVFQNLNGPTYEVYDPNNNYVYVLDQSSAQVSVFSNTAVVGTVYLNQGPTFGVYNPSNRYVYVLAGNGIVYLLT